jgi:outer membrane protein assembly factor BamA
MNFKQLRYLIFFVLLLLVGKNNHAQSIQFKIEYVYKSTNFNDKELLLKTQFATEKLCTDYIQQLPQLLQSKGYISASIDSVIQANQQFMVHLFIGEKYVWQQLKVQKNDWPLLTQAGIQQKQFETTPFNPQLVEQVQEKLLNYFETVGHPFASVSFDSVLIADNKVSAQLNIDKGIVYKMDSVRIFGNAKISKAFLYRYLNIQPNSVYNQQKLTTINQRLLELPFLQQSQPWQLAMLGKSYLVDLFLENKKSNQVDAIVGLLPNNQQLDGSLLLTVDAKIKLQNAFAKGETVALNWQQIQPKSPRLNLQFQQPYIFNSQFGFDFQFDLFKRDSTFLNLQTNIGILYEINAQQKTKIVYQSYRTNLLDVDTNTIKITKRLPDIIDVVTNSLGIDYTFNNTNYRFNPGKGNELQLLLTAGNRRIIQNNAISQIKDVSFNYTSLYDSLDANSYQFKIKLQAAKYWPVGRYGVIKTGIQSGLIQSPTIFRNEMFQIGGFKTLRGFDEESIFTNQFAIGTLEYRYLFGLNAYFSAFSDMGYSYNSIMDKTLTYVGFGAGMAFETKQGIFNINIAAGKRNDLPFDLRQSKIHIGFVSLF